NAGAILRGFALLSDAERRAWSERIVTTARASVIREGSFANWPVEYPSHPRSDTKMLVQWCHGAPGFVTSLAALADHWLDELLLGAGEWIWAAGPLKKGAGLCHGTAGNGYAFLKLYRRTRNRRWLERARAFAMHAISQSELDTATYGRRRYSLYTGDPGLA